MEQQHDPGVEGLEVKEWQAPELTRFDVAEVTRSGANPGDDGLGVFTAS